MGLYMENVGATIEEKILNLHEIGEGANVCGTNELSGLDKHEELVKEGKRYVCMVDNGAFQAIGVAYDQKELTHFNGKHDDRFKMWWILDVETIKQYAPNWESYKDGLK